MVEEKFNSFFGGEGGYTYRYTWNTGKWGDWVFLTPSLIDYFLLGDLKRPELISKLVSNLPENGSTNNSESGSKKSCGYEIRVGKVESLCDIFLNMTD